MIKGGVRKIPIYFRIKWLDVKVIPVIVCSSIINTK